MSDLNVWVHVGKKVEPFVRLDDHGGSMQITTTLNGLRDTMLLTLEGNDLHIRFAAAPNPRPPRKTEEA